MYFTADFFMKQSKYLDLRQWMEDFFDGLE